MARKRNEKPPERKHKVSATLQAHSLTKAGSALKLEIYARGDKIGQLVIGRGSLYWYGGHRHKSKRIPWSDFASMMDQLAYG